MHAILRTVLSASVGFLVLGGGLVAAHPPEHDAPPAVDETLRTLNIIAAHGKEVRTQSQSAPRDAGLALSFDPNTTASGSQSYGFNNGVRAVACVNVCQAPPVKGQAVLANASEDVQLQWEDSVVGQIAYSWTYSSSLPLIPPNGQPYAWIQFYLSMGDVSYGSDLLYVKGTRGTLVEAVQFNREVQCDDSEPPANGSQHHHEECVDSFDAGAAELWAHDVHLTVTIQRMDYQYVTLGDQLVVKLETNGRSFLQVHEQPPPPPVEVTLEAVASEDAVQVEWSDEDGDGEEELGEVQFVPAPGVFAVGAALAGLAWLRRRKST
ncbi:MAG TPA: hypothetical protein VI818_07460 [Candidatus Thermoplasmatota archaeon]|nr:hypothetical protein [Candidatus Thermoplasmatota archaeon]